MGMIGNQPANNFLAVTKDTFNGNASSYTLSKAATTNGVAVYVENVRQIPTTAYSVSGTTLTFTGTTPAGTGNVYVLHHNTPASTATHPAAQALEATTGVFTGIVTNASQPCFYAYMSSGTFAPAASNSTKTPLNSTLVNIGNCWSTTNHLFTAPVAGTYSITWGFTFQDSDNSRYVASRIYKNGSQIGSAHRQSQPTGQGGNQYDGIDGLKMILTFAKDETFYIILQPSATLSVANEFGTYMSGFLIG